MATSPRGLWFVLTLWIVALRPSATVPSGTPDSVWWGTQESKDLQSTTRQHLRDGKLADVEADYQRCLARARELRDQVAEARCLFGIAGTHTARFDYEGAVRLYLQARDVAAARGDRLDLGAIQFNLSNLYLQASDEKSALRAAEAAQATIHNLSKVYYKPQLLLQLGLLHRWTGDRPGAPWFEQAIEAAWAGQPGDPSLVAVEAQAWDMLGEERLAGNDLECAEQAYLRAYLLRKLFWQRDLGFSYARLGALRLAQAKAASGNNVALLADAERLTLRARERSANFPAYRLKYQLGRIRLAQGNRRAALSDLSAAVDSAEDWLAGIPAALSSLDGATGLVSEVFNTFVQAATSYGMETGEQAWILRGFQTAEAGRAANPKFSLDLAEVWRRRMPRAFWQALDQLRSEEASLLRSGAKESPVSEKLKLELTEMEAGAGLRFFPNNNENFRSSDSLNHFRRGLGDSEVLLSFALGDQQSFLWVVTKETLATYRLAPREQIRVAVREFREAVEDGRTEAETRGRHLYEMLFGQVRPQEARKPDWLLSLDDELFKLPFAALVPGERLASKEPSQKRNGDIVYLAEEHSFQVVPGALLVSGASRVKLTRAVGTFLGVGDPIYNVADPRWRGTHSWLSRMWLQATSDWSSKASTEEWPRQYNRLPGSGREVELSAQAWGSSRNTTLLEGAEARTERFRGQVARAPSSTHLAVIHLATHVLIPQGSHDRAALVFSLDPQGHPETLTETDIGFLNVPGALVVMTGCSTAGGPQSGLGLAGLARAWRLAGASSVVATQWPVKDFTGQMLAGFYQYVRNFSAAEALRKSQIDEIRLGALPASWAAYQVFGDAR